MAFSALRTNNNIGERCNEITLSAITSLVKSDKMVGK